MKNLMLLMALVGSLLMTSCWVCYDDYYDRPSHHERPMRSGHYYHQAPPSSHYYSPGRHRGR